jgi:ankyrin repeat protein
MVAFVETSVLGITTLDHRREPSRQQPANDPAAVLKHVKLMLWRDPEAVFRMDSNGRTLLHWAAIKGAKDMAEVLLDCEAEVNAQDNDDDTPLHWAALMGRRDVAELLLAKQADVNAWNTHGRTPLQWAVFMGHKNVAELLVASGAH